LSRLYIGDKVVWIDDEIWKDLNIIFVKIRE